MRFKRLFIGIILISVSSLLHFDILISDFRVTFALVSMGAFLYLYRKVNPIIFGAIIALTTYFIRLIAYAIQFGEISSIAVAYLPEMAFYITYGVVFMFAVYKRDLWKSEDIFVVALTGDFLSNIVEMTIRFAFLNQPFTKAILSMLFLVALIRTIMLIAILKVMKLYRLLLIKEEHEIRYQRLIHQTMLLKDEMYWFEKNKVRIESSMANAYRLFELLKKSDNPQLAKESLTIAGDIHEIKKEYELVLRGFKEITEVEYEVQSMRYSDVIKILDRTMEYGLKQLKKNINIDYASGSEFSTTSHFELMSILRNLISNSVDALDKKGNISVIHSREGDSHHFIVEDDGKGIPEKNIYDIFNPGYSTKIDYSTGEINRGLGLSLVKSLVENHFEGKLSIASTEKSFTRIHITIDSKHLEG
jgi:two-component system sensor histidine kinase YcbA